MTRFAAIPPAALLLALPAAAQDLTAPADFDLGEIVFSAEAEPVAAGRTGASVTIVTKEELEAAPQTRVDEVLATLPGVSARSNGPLGTRSALSIRGVPQQNLAVRVDGIDVSDPSGTQVAFDFGTLTTSDVARIEVLRGAQSARFGSEAVGGAIDITTRRARADGLAQDLLLEYGTHDTARLSYGLSYGGEGFEANLTASYVGTDGFSAADEDDGNEEADGFEGGRLSFTGRYDLSEAATLAVAAFVADARFEYDEELGGAVFDGTPDDVTRVDQRGARAALELAALGWDHTFDLARYEIDRGLTGTNGFGGFDFRYEGRRTSFGWSAMRPVGRGDLTLGIERTEERYGDRIGTDFPPVTTQGFDTDVNSAFAEYAFAATPEVDLNLAIRRDEHSRFGGFTSGRVAGAWRIGEATTLRASLSNGFRAPSPYELFGAFVGEPSLEPEESVSAEIGVERTFGPATLRATAFRTEVENLIDYDTAATFLYVQREGTVSRDGVEVEGDYAFANGAVLSGNYTYVDGGGDVVLLSSGFTAAFPRHSLAARLDLPVGERARLGLTALHENGRPGAGDFTRIGARASYELAPGVEGFVRIENLGDVEYQTIPGYGTSDRAVFAGLRASF